MYESNDNRSAGLYIHVPFCRNKCEYCGFYSTTDLTLVSFWKYSLLREVSSYQDRFNPVDTIYFGGGTPSCLNTGVIEDIMTELREGFRIEPAAEITVEVNPDDVSIGLLHSFRDSGVNRLSIGIQSLDDKILEFLGRRHTAAQAMKAVAASRRERFENVGIDLIYNIPGQSFDGWMEVLRTALDLRPEHVSCYELSFEQGTPLGNRIRKSRIRKRMSERDRRFFLETSRVISDRGYVHYEVSNFALDDTYKSRHNEKYWKRDPYLGLGPSAHSMKGKNRWWNMKEIESYCSSVRTRGHGVESLESLTDEQVALELLFLGFRNTHGIPRSLIMSDQHNATITQSLVERNLLRDEGNYFVPTVEGYLLADRLPLDYRL